MSGQAIVGLLFLGVYLAFFGVLFGWWGLALAGTALALWLGWCGEFDWLTRGVLGARSCRREGRHMRRPGIDYCVRCRAA